MNRFVLRSVCAAVIILVGSAVPAAAQETAASGRPFGEHVSHCAQTMGFSGHHNPGMHRGITGWDHHTCGA